MPSSGVQTCARSEEHTSELQSLTNLVCRLLLEKKNNSLPRGSRNARSHAIPPHSTERSRLPPPSIKTYPRLLPSYFHIIFSFRVFFFFNDAAPPEIYTLSLHAALPI